MTLLRFAAKATATVLLTAGAGVASAEPVSYAFDKDHTEVRVCWNHLGVSRQCADFLEYEGGLVFDAADPSKSQLDVTFKTASIHTRNPVFDGHMKGEKLFDTAKFPEATFKSTKFEKTSEKTGKVTGDLTIKGVTKPITLDVTLNFNDVHPMKKVQSLGIGATGTLKRGDFNVSLALPYVSDEIALEIQSELNKKG